MRISSDGKITIGNTASVQPLTVAGNVLFRTSTADGFENRFQFIPGGSGDAGNFYVYNASETATIRLNANGTSYFNGGRLVVGGTAYAQNNAISFDANGQIDQRFVAGTARNQHLNIITGKSNGLQFIQDSSNNLTYRFHAGTDNAVLLDATGVGVSIGTSSHFGKLNVDVSAGAPASSGNMTNGFTVHNTSGGRAIQLGVNESGGYTYLQSAYVNNAGVAQPIAFFTGATEKMRILANGNITFNATSNLNASKFQISTASGLGANVDVFIANTSGIKSVVTTGGNVGRSSHAADLTFETKAAGATGNEERMSLNSKGVLSVKSNDTNQASFEQTLAIKKQLGNNGVAIPVAYVDHTHSLDVTVIVKQDTSNVASGRGHSVLAYGSGSAGLTQVSGSGNVSSVAIAYLNTNPSGQNYVLTVTPTFSAGVPPVAYVTIRGNSTGAICEY